ncbi:alpha/beta fold hydrolase [Candidatus Poribacteria bacterium]|nr:alpha/beta fold hydrolase [Candidatus Poribacteria bacterium]
MYLVPLEERIKVSVPVAAIGTLQRGWESGGISDAEQNLPKSVLYGVDHGDLLSLVAPRPLLIIRECKDYIRLGTRDAYYEAERLYHILGVEDSICLVEINAEHGYSKEMREQMYGWLNRWFHKEEEGSEEPPLELETEENLNCTESGQLMSSLENSKTVFELNQAYAEKISPTRRMPQELEEYAQYRSEVRRNIEAALGYTDVVCPLEPEIVGIIERDGYLIEKIIYQSESDIAVPGLAFIPQYHTPPYPGLLYLHENGKDIDAQVGGQIEQLTKAGYLVFAIDPRGMGETKPARVNNYDKQGEDKAKRQDGKTARGQEGNSEFRIPTTAQLLGFEAVLAYDCLKFGTTLFGMQLQDVIKGLDYLFKREDLNIDQIGCIGWGVGGLLALYAAAIDERLEQVAAINALCLYKSLLDSPLYSYHFSTFIPDVIRRFDLCDVAALIAPRTLMLINSVDAMKNQVSQETLEKHYAWTRKIYRFLQNPEGLMILSAKAIEYPERNETLLRGMEGRGEWKDGRKACRKQTGRESEVSRSFHLPFGGAASWIRKDVLQLPGRKR